MTQPEVDTRRSKSGRSPSYPGIPLEAAIERARILWEREKRNAAPVALIMKHWGYNNPTSGTAAVNFAALKKFGLIVDEGSGISRPARLTDLALEILLNPEPAEAIRRAALNPPIHREFWTEYGVALPSDEALKWTLIQRGFTSSGASEFIREYRDTIAYAELAQADQDTELEPRSPTDEVKGEAGEAESIKRPPRRSGGMNGTLLTIPVPIAGGPPVMIEGEFPITEASWDQFMAVLNAMKPGLVSRESADPQE
jgi:hypothetical protein